MDIEEFETYERRIRAIRRKEMASSPISEAGREFEAVAEKRGREHEAWRKTSSDGDRVYREYMETLKRTAPVIYENIKRHEERARE